MAGIELLSDQGFRADGRRSTELRKIQCRLGVFDQADGSAYIEQGNTRVLAAVYGPHEVSVAGSLVDKVVTRPTVRPVLRVKSKPISLRLYIGTCTKF